MCTDHSTNVATCNMTHILRTTPAKDDVPMQVVKEKTPYGRPLPIIHFTALSLYLLIAC